MKKLLVLIAVLVFSTAAMAGTVSVVVSPPANPEGYMPSEIITVQLIGAGYANTSPATTIGKMAITALTADAGTAEGVGTLHTLLMGSLYQSGTLVNNGGVLISDIIGGLALGVNVGPPDGEALYTFDFHVPEVPYSTIITLGIDGIDLKSPFNTQLVADVIPAEIHVVPEPMTIALLGLGGLFLRRRK